MKKTIQQLAADFSAQFETKTRDNGDEFLCLKSDKPEELRDLVRAAHGSHLPNDWSFRFIVNALDAISNVSGDDAYDAISSIEPSIYTSDLTAWLASSNARVEYLTDVLQDGNYSPTSSITGFDLLQEAQLRERREVFDSVFNSLCSLVDAQ